MNLDDCFSSALDLPKTSLRDLKLGLHINRSPAFRERSNLEYLSLWTAFIDSDSVRSLKISFDEDDVHFVHPILSAFDVFRNRRVLHLAVTHDSNLGFLAYCFDLWELVLEPFGSSDASLTWQLPSSWLPELQMYCGWYLDLFFSSIVRGRHLRHLDITGKNAVEEDLSGLRGFGSSVDVRRT